MEEPIWPFLVYLPLAFLSMIAWVIVFLGPGTTLITWLVENSKNKDRKKKSWKWTKIFGITTLIGIGAAIFLAFAQLALGIFASQFGG